MSPRPKFPGAGNLKTVEIKMLRDRVVSSTKGHTVRFEANVPKHVPIAILEDCLQVGGVPTSETAVNEIKDEPVAKVAPQGGDRSAKILAKIMEMVGRNQREDFTAAGKPDIRVMERELGFKIDSRERDEIWAEVEAETNGG
jgi:hypothetical protein